jgi:hypothetical protein
MAAAVDRDIDDRNVQLHHPEPQALRSNGYQRPSLT